MKLQYEISATGLNQVRSVLRGVEREAMASNRRQAADAARSMRNVRTGPRGTAQLELRAKREAFREEMKLQTEQARQQAYWQRARLGQIRQTHQAEVKAIKDRERAEKTAAREAERDAARVARANERAASRRRIMAAGMGRGFASSVRGAVGTVARFGVGAASIAGGLAVGGALREQMAVEKQASELSNANFNANKERVSKSQLVSEAGGVRGFGRAETMGAMRMFFSRTGNLNAFRDSMQTLGKVAITTGVDFSELGEAAGQAFNVISDDIKDPKQQVAALQEVMTNLAVQGNLGAIEIREFASTLGELGGATRMFKGGSVHLLETMGAMAQLSVRTGGSATAAEASTSVARFATDIVKNQGRFGKHGINVFTDKTHTQLKDPIEIIKAVVQKTRGDLTQVQDLFDIRSLRAFRGVSDAYVKAEARKPGSGMAAMQSSIEKFSGAKIAPKELERQAAARYKDADVQITETIKQFNTAIGTKLLPVVTTQLIPALVRLTPYVAQAADKVADFANFLSKNPYEGIGLLIAGLVAKDIAMAGIGKVIAAAVASMFARSAGGAAAGGLLSQIGAGAAAGAAGRTGIGVLTGGARGALTGAAAGLGAAGAVTAAGVGVAAAGYEGHRLSKESGGIGGVLEGLKGLFEGQGYAKGVDDFMNRQAREQSMIAHKQQLAADKMADAANRLAAALPSAQQPQRNQPIVAR